ncbi:MAG: hypothetical protein LUO79_06690 [Methanomassiliicoccales archaeon]|nr:hypothetical protein [Methanomassiliicoccales archaeon]
MRQNILQSETKILFAQSGGVCAFPQCGRSLVEPGSSVEGALVVGEIAHIVAESRQGPRGREPLSETDRNKHTNLILVCPEHHKVVDSRPETYSVAVLRQMKLDHESRVRKAVSVPAPRLSASPRTETIYSTVLPVTHLPDAVFSALCTVEDATEDQLKKLITYPDSYNELAPFLLRENKIFAFQDLRLAKHPFSSVTDSETVGMLRSRDLWRDAEGKRRYITLLNRSLYKYTARVAVRYDPVHYRFYFPPKTLASPRTVRYRSLAGRWSSRRVVWQPVKKSTGETRNYWWHLAAGLKFHQMADMQWCLSIRPERHLTTDGETPLPSEMIGRRVTRLKARMYNDLYLGEVNFWRDYLSKGAPRITLNFGNQSGVIEAAFIRVGMKWPGIPGDEKTVGGPTEDDLFTLSDLAETVEGEVIEWIDEDNEAPEDDPEIDGD